jgi:hypothetical protein
MIRLFPLLLVASLAYGQTENAGNLELSLSPETMLTLNLSSGDYRIVPGASDKLVIKSQAKIPSARRKVRFGLNASSEEASVIVDGPHNYAALIQVPTNINLNIRLNGGRLTMAGIEGDKNIESNAGRLDIDVGHPEKYRMVEATVNTGAIDASAFHSSKSGAMQSFSTSGPGKYSLHVHVGTGQIRLFTDEVL